MEFFNLKLNIPPIFEMKGSTYMSFVSIVGQLRRRLLELKICANYFTLFHFPAVFNL